MFLIHLRGDELLKSKNLWSFIEFQCLEIYKMFQPRKAVKVVILSTNIKVQLKRVSSLMRHDQVYHFYLYSTVEVSFLIPFHFWFDHIISEYLNITNINFNLTYATLLKNKISLFSSLNSQICIYIWKYIYSRDILRYDFFIYKQKDRYFYSLKLA